MRVRREGEILKTAKCVESGGWIQDVKKKIRGKEGEIDSYMGVKSWRSMNSEKADTEQKNRGKKEFRKQKEQLKRNPCGWREKLNQKENLLNFLQNWCQEESFLKEYFKPKCEGINLV